MFARLFFPYAAALLHPALEDTCVCRNEWEAGQTGMHSTSNDPLQPIIQALPRLANADLVVTRANLVNDPRDTADVNVSLVF